MMFGYELFHNEAITIDDLQVKFSRIPKLPQSKIFILKSLIPLPQLHFTGRGKNLIGPGNAAANNNTVAQPLVFILKRGKVFNFI